jgi:hypothetical protein
MPTFHQHFKEKAFYPSFFPVKTVININTGMNINGVYLGALKARDCKARSLK